MKPATPVLTQVGKFVIWQPVMGAINYTVSTMLLSPNPASMRLWHPVGDTGGQLSFDAEKILVEMASRPGLKGKIKVCAIAAGVILSDAAELELSPLPVPTPSPLVLAAPAGFLQTGVALTWPAVPNAVSYTVIGVIDDGTSTKGGSKVEVTSPIYDGKKLVDLLAANPALKITVCVSANGPGGEVSPPGLFQITVPAPTPPAKNWKEKIADWWKSFTEWLKKKPSTAGNVSLLERPAVKWGIVVVAVLLIVGIPLALIKRARNKIQATETATTSTTRIIRLVDAPKPAATITPAKDWTESTPDDMWNLTGTSEVIIPPDKDIVLVTPVHTDQRVEIISGLNFEYAYNIFTLQRPVWANAEILAQMKNRGQRIENKAYRFKTGKWPLTLKFEIIPKSS